VDIFLVVQNASLPELYGVWLWYKLYGTLSESANTGTNYALCPPVYPKKVYDTSPGTFTYKWSVL